MFCEYCGAEHQNEDSLCSGGGAEIGQISKQPEKGRKKPLAITAVIAALVLATASVTVSACISDGGRTTDAQTADTGPAIEDSGSDVGGSNTPSPRDEPDYRDYYKPLLDEYRSPSAETIESLNDVENIYGVFTQGYDTEFYDKLLIDVMRSDLVDPNLAATLQPDDVYFAYSDLNGDDIPELIIGIDCGPMGRMPLDIYTLDANNEVVFLYRYFDMNAVMGFEIVLQDGSPLVYERYADQGYSYALLMKVASGKLTAVDEYSADVDWGLAEAEPVQQFYHNGTLITEAEWAAATERLATLPRLGLDWTGLVTT
jgi:hypothetical protein